MTSSNPQFICTRCGRALRQQSASASISRSFSTTRIRDLRQRTYTPSSEPPEDIPRWKQTPPAMKMPIRLRPHPNQPAWRVNTDEKLLDDMYDRFIGRAGAAAKGQKGVESTRGSALLPEEIKWLAITHKSFDHARRGSNDRLAFLGKRILDLQTSLALLNSASPSPTTPSKNIYTHPSLTGLENITAFAKHAVLSPARLSSLASSYGVDKVVRWQPKKTENLKGSGVDAVLAHAMYSIIGALALQRGGEVAASTARERILKPLGLV